MGKRKLSRDEGRQTHKGVNLPRKRFFRARAHCNPLNDGSFTAPVNPQAYDWAPHYPEVFSALPAGADPPVVRFADVGCGFGGLLVRLSPLYPDTLMLGMEIRDKVAEYVRERALMLRKQNPGQYTNIDCLRTNAMKYILHYFSKGQLTKLFFLFPDPHFKVANHRRRIINRCHLDEYAYILQPGGKLYTATDVEELGDWMRDKCNAHPLFRQLSDEELQDDPAAGLLTEATEEAQKVARNAGKTWRHCFERLPDSVMWDQPLQDTEQEQHNVDDQTVGKPC